MNFQDGVLLGAVGAYDWNGAVLKDTKHGKVIPPKSSYRNEFPEELKNHGAYLGVCPSYHKVTVIKVLSGEKMTPVFLVCPQVTLWGRSFHLVALSSTWPELRGSTTPGRSSSSP